MERRAILFIRPRLYFLMRDYRNMYKHFISLYVEFCWFGVKRKRERRAESMWMETTPRYSLPMSKSVVHTSEVNVITLALFQMSQRCGSIFHVHI